jgi:N-acetylated-alpha-linked acidic dipeptidase
MDACKAVRYPGTQQTVYDHWLASAPAGASEPMVGNLGGGSDHVGFYAHVGIPSLGAGFSGSNGIYHSAYDNFAWYERFGDTAFVFGPALANVYGVLGLRFANADFLPYDVPRYARDLRLHFLASAKEIRSYHPEYIAESLLRATDDLDRISDQYARAMELALQNGKMKPARRTAINQKLIALEKSFLDAKGMHFGTWYQSLYAAPDPYSGYAAWMLPGLKYEASVASVQNLPEWEGRYLNAVRNLGRKMEILIRDLRK